MWSTLRLLIIILLCRVINLLSHLYTDVILQPLNHINEYIAMCDIIDHYTATNPTRKPLFIADRGFVSLNVFAHAIENNAYFLVRARESNPRSMLATIKLPDSPEYDIIFERWLTKKIQRLLKQSLKCIKLLQTELLITSTLKVKVYTTSLFGL